MDATLQEWLKLDLQTVDPAVWATAGVAVAVSAALLIWLVARPRRGRSSPGTGAPPRGRFGGLAAELRRRFGSGGRLNDDDRDRLRELLVAADLGPAAADRVLDALAAGEAGAAPLEERLTAVVASLLADHAADPDGLPADGVLVIVGVNGSGKTTTIAKLAHRWQQAGRSVVLGAADTFRAAAAEQLEAWAERIGARVVRQQAGADPAAVAFDAVKAAESANATAIIDTAGRIHGHEGLMNELKKIVRVVGKAREGAPHAIWLTLDASQGQTAIEQARRFAEAVDVSGILVNKLDGEGRGGFVLRIVEELNLPVVGVGVGERIDDFVPFDGTWFARALVYGSEAAQAPAVA